MQAFALRPRAPRSLAAAFALALAACATGEAQDTGRGSEVVEVDAGPKPNRPARPDGGGFDLSDAGPFETTDGAPLDAGCETQTVGLLENGDFEAGAGVGWVEGSSGGFPLVVPEDDPLLPEDLVLSADSGTFFAYLGGYNGARDEIQQDVEVPAGTIETRLRGVGRIDTQETVARAFDEAFIEIQSPEGEVLEELARFSNEDDTADRFLRINRVVAGDFGGQTIRLELRVTADVSLLTHFFFDTLVLEVVACTGGITVPALEVDETDGIGVPALR